MYRSGMLLMVSVFLMALGCGLTHEAGKPAMTPEKTTEAILIPTPEKTSAQNGKIYCPGEKENPPGAMEKDRAGTDGRA